jgi:tetratricopeptide (TPR) repeat protein
MDTVGYIIFGIGTLITVGWCLQIREKAKREQATEGSMEISGFLMTISLILIPLLHLSPFNLIWMIPISFFLGLLSTTTPIRFLHIFASIYFRLWYFGTSNLGLRYFLDEEYEKAIDTFKEEISKNPLSVEAHFNLALTYGKIGQQENEIATYEKAIKLDSKRPEFYFNLAIIYNTTDDKQKVITFLKETIRLKPNHLKAHYNLSITYFKTGNLENAVDEYKIVKKLDSGGAKELEELLF